MIRSILFVLLLLALPAAACGLPAEPLPSAPVQMDKTMDELLRELEAETLRNQPEAAALLHPGISEAALTEVEAGLETPLHPEIRALYQWHDGMDGAADLFPGYEFIPLEEAVRERQVANEEYRLRGLELFMTHEKNWLAVFMDPAGDGYFYDFKTEYSSGGVFFVFREADYRINFPSLRNLLAAIIECYRQGAYAGTQTLDFGLEVKIMETYGRVSP